MDVSVIMINYNTFSLTKDALDSIFRETKGIDYEVILIDNASPDGSGDRLSALYGNKIVYLQSGGNLGTSKAFNIALKHASGKYVLWLNTDILLKENFIKKLFDYMESDPNCGICGGNLFNGRGEPTLSYDKELLTGRVAMYNVRTIVVLFRALFKNKSLITSIILLALCVWEGSSVPISWCAATVSIVSVASTKTSSCMERKQILPIALRTKPIILWCPFPMRT